jgi:hypothetical protein
MLFNTPSKCLMADCTPGMRALSEVSLIVYNSRLGGGWDQWFEVLLFCFFLMSLLVLL